MLKIVILKNLFNSKSTSSKISTYLRVITGPMFVGKTDLLIKEINQFKSQGYKVLVLKPDVDRRFSHCYIVSHSQNRAQAAPIVVNQFIQQVQKLIAQDNYQIVVIDELHFFPPAIIPFLEQLLQKYIILLSGLNKGVANNNLEIMNQILAKADYIDRLNANCQICQGLGSQIQLIDAQQKPTKNPEFVGGAEKYRLLCRKCANF